MNREMKSIISRHSVLCNLDAFYARNHSHGTGAQRYVASHEAMYIDGIPHMERADVGIIIRLQGCIRAFQHTESNAFVLGALLDKKRKRKRR